MLMAGVAGGLIALIASMILFFVVLAIAIYVYMGFAFMAIAKKANLEAPGLAWIPAVGPVIIAYQASKMHWWPWLLLIGCIIPFVNFIAAPVFTVFAIIWMWKMYEAIKRPGWWAIMMIIPIVGLVFAGIAAWSKD
ncbi:MAG: hypothetical protein ACP5N2_06685 [Candidatus Nanoarchaeia archaeon]